MFTTVKLCTVLVPQTPDTFTGGGVRVREEQDKHIDQIRDTVIIVASVSSVLVFKPAAVIRFISVCFPFYFT